MGKGKSEILLNDRCKPENQNVINLAPQQQVRLSSLSLLPSEEKEAQTGSDGATSQGRRSQNSFQPPDAHQHERWSQTRRFLATVAT